MFDREGAFIADHPQGGDDIFPVSVIVAIADAAEDPAAVQLVREVLGVQYAVDSGVVLVDLGVLRMEVEDRMFLAEGADCGDGVNTLPDQMAGVEVGADFRADSGAELEQGFDVVNAEAGVHLKRELGNAVLSGKLDLLLPEGDELLFPLPFEDFGEIVRPGTGDPVRMLGLFAVAGATGEAVDGVDAQFLRQTDGVVQVVLKLRGNLLVGVEVVAMGGKGADFEAGSRERVLKLL